MTDNDDLEASSSSNAGSPLSGSAARIQDIRIEPDFRKPSGGANTSFNGAGGTTNGASANTDDYARRYPAPGELLTGMIEKVRLTTMLVGYFYTGLAILLIVVSIILLAPVAISVLDHQSPILMNMARIMISLLAIALGAFAWVIILGHGAVTAELETTEETIDIVRDQALIQMQAARYNLEDLTERLRFPKETQAAGPLEYIEMAKQIGPLLSLLLSKERSILTLGVEGLKFFQTVKKVLNK